MFWCSLEQSGTVARTIPGLGLGSAAGSWESLDPVGLDLFPCKVGAMVTHPADLTEEQLWEMSTEAFRGTCPLEEIRVLTNGTPNPRYTLGFLLGS